jgi:hypothetical protein
MGRSAQLRPLRDLRRLGSPDAAGLGQNARVTLREAPLEKRVTLPDGRDVSVRIGLAQDSYIPRRDLDTVVLELWDEERGEHLAGVSTILSPDDTAAGHALLREVVEGLRSGAVEASAGALERLADRWPPQ